jgi:hypothetical protein
MSVNLTTALQNVSGRDPNYVDSSPTGAKQSGTVLNDTLPAAPGGKTNVTWQADVYGNISASVATSTTPSGAANLVEATPNGSSGAASLRALVPADLPVGSASQLGALQVDGTTITASSGVISAVASASGMVLIQKQALVAPAATVTFSSIPQTYTNLLLVFSGTNSSGGQQNVLIEFNGDTTQTDYSYSFLLNNAGTVTGGFAFSTPGVLTGISINSGGSNSRAMITNYSSTTVNKVVESTFMCINPNNTAFSGTAGGLWNSTAAITSIVAALASGNFAAGTVFSLYGLA